MAYVLVSHGIREFGRREWNRRAAKQFHPYKPEGFAYRENIGQNHPLNKTRAHPISRTRPYKTQ